MWSKKELIDKQAAFWVLIAKTPKDLSLRRPPEFADRPTGTTAGRRWSGRRCGCRTTATGGRARPLSVVFDMRSWL